jgi:hypothetical protein
MFRLPLIALCLAFALSPRLVAEEEFGGEPWAGGEAVRSTNGTIMFDANSRGPETREERRQPYFIRRFDTLAANPDSPRVTTWPPENASLAVESAAPQTSGVNFTAATLADTGAFPPDTMGAVGPAQFIVAVNGRIRSFTKAGVADGVMNVDTDVFFTPVMTPPATNNFTSDPRIRYDRLSRRWFIIIIDVPQRSGALPNRVMLAVSDGPVITASTVWSFYQFQHDLVSPAGDTGQFADYPTLGIDANALYIGVNVFGTRGTGSFQNTTVFVVRKSSVLNGGPIVVTAFRKLISNSPNTSGPYTPQGVDNYDPNTTEGYIIGVDANFYGKLQLRRISNPGGTPTISAQIPITIPLNGGTITVPHLGNTGGSAGNLDGLDYRLMAAHIRNGRLWTTANMAVDNTGAPGGSDTRNAVRWYEFQGIATGQTPALVQSGTLFQPSASNTTDQRHYWMGTIMVSGQGHAAMGFSVAGANERVNAGTAGRLASDSLGTLRAPELYTATTGSYNPPGDPGGGGGRRWGDYSYTSLDPNDDMTMWTIQEFCDANNSYGVRVLQLLAPPPATPIGCSPATLTAGSSNVSVTVTGAVVNGSGFFDPGAVFSNRLAAAVSGGGVTVTSVTYNNTSNIVLHVNVSASAASGGRTVTVINPDGQQATSASALLTVTGGQTNAPPTLVTITNSTIDEDALFTFTASATDTNGDAITFSLGAGAPFGAGINSTSGVFSWFPTESQGPNTNTLRVIATDNGSPSLSATQTFTIIVREVNRAPVFSLFDRTFTEGDVLNIGVDAFDPDLPTNTLAYSFAQSPAGMTINTNTGAIFWMPTEAQAPSTNTVKVVVTDNGVPSLSTTQAFIVTVHENNSAPTLAVISNRTVYIGETVSFTATATDTDLPPNVLTFALQPGAPAAAMISSAGAFSWTTTNTDTGLHTIGIRVSDDGAPSLSDVRTFDVDVVALPAITATLAGTDLTLTWPAFAGRTYRVQFKTNFTEAAWSDLPDDVIATSDSASKTDTTAAEQRFYRLKILP